MLKFKKGDKVVSCTPAMSARILAAGYEAVNDAPKAAAPKAEKANADEGKAKGKEASQEKAGKKG